MKDYYSILGVSRRAASPEIKRAFRRLAIMYHPDRNPSPDAEQIIKEVIEAYEVLEDPEKRAIYDQMLGISAPIVVEQAPQKPRHRDPRYRPKSVSPNYKSEKQLVVEMVMQYMPVAFGISIFTLFFSLLLALDYSLPTNSQKEKVTVVDRVGRSKSPDWRVYTEEGNEYSVDIRAIRDFPTGASLTAVYSPVMHIPFMIVNNESNHETDIVVSVYGNFIFFPVLLMITSVFGVTVRRAFMFRFNLGIMNAVLFILTIIFLLMSRMHTL